MKVVVCVKMVKSEFVGRGNNENELYQMNPYDLYAFKEIIKIKEQVDCNVVCLCMGPKESEYILVKAIAMGADEAILLNDIKFAGSDTVATTYILSRAVSKIGNVDFIICGDKSLDGETGQVVFGLSERLKFNCVTGLERIESLNETGIVAVRNKKEIGVLEKLKVPCSVVLSFANFLLKQPSVSLIAIKKAKQRGITIWNADDLNIDSDKCGIRGSKTHVINVKSDLVKKESCRLEGTAAEKSAAIVKILVKR